MPLDTLPANSAADLFKSLAEDVLTDLKAIGESLVARAAGEDQELVQRTLRRAALNQAMLISNPNDREKYQRVLAANVGTLHNIAVKYQLVGSRELRDFIVRLVTKVVDLGFSLVGLPGAGSAIAGVSDTDV